MKRRRLLFAGGALLAAPLAIRAQQPEPSQRGKTHRVAYLAAITPVARLEGPNREPGTQLFVGRLAELGYVEGRNLVLDFYSLEGRNERIPEVLAAIVRSKADVIYNIRQVVVEKHLAETAGIPVVTLATWNLVGTGAVQSLARPAGSVTGFIVDVDETVEAKRLELLREINPRMKRVAYLGEALMWDSPAGANVRAAAKRLALTLFHAAYSGGDVQAAAAVIEREAPDAIFVAGGTASFVYRKQVGEFVSARRLPSIAMLKENAEAGCLISYGVDIMEIAARSAGYVARILGGAKPGDLPIQQPEKFEMVVNLKAARALGLGIPQSILLRADRLIE